MSAKDMIENDITDNGSWFPKLTRALAKLGAGGGGIYLHPVYC